MINLHEQHNWLIAGDCGCMFHGAWYMEYGHASLDGNTQYL
jgi:hypothetical protein